MAIWKGTMWFKQDTAGWSECVYLNADSARNAALMFAPLAQARAGVLAQGVNLTRWHTSLLGQKGILAASGVKANNLQLAASLPFVGMLLTVQGKGPGQDVNYSREYFIRGLPQSFVDAINNPTAFKSNPTYSRLQAFLSVLANGNFLLQVADKDNPWYPVSQVVTSSIPTLDADGNVIGPGNTFVNCLLPEGAIIPATDPVTGRQCNVCLRGVKWSVPRVGNVNGVWAVAASLPGIVALEAPFPQVGDYQSGGFVQLRQTIYTPIRAAKMGRLGNRKCGKPLYPDPMPPEPPPPLIPPNALTSGVGAAIAPMPPPDPLPQWNIPGIRVTLATMQDTAAEVFAGYTLTASGLPGCIRISPIVNRPNTFFVGLSGTDWVHSSATDLPNDIMAFFSAPDAYLQSILAALEAAVPHGSKLWLFGHSLGGMEAQNVSDYINRDHYTIERVVGFGSPMTNLSYPYKRRILFAAESDWVPLLGRVAFPSAFVGSPELTFIYDPPGVSVFNIVAIHNSYPSNPDFENYGPDGEKLASNLIPTLELGPVQVFTAPATGPIGPLSPQQKEILREAQLLEEELIP